jgi:uncharacterized protein (DUF2249 family)
MSEEQVLEPELDVRPLAKPDKHPTIFAAYRGLAPGESFVLVNDHDPRHLRDEFEADHAGSYAWDYLLREPRNWRIKITKLTTAPLPQVLVDTNELGEAASEPDVSGAVWKLSMRDRDLDSNVVALPPGGSIEPHVGPDLDVLVHVLGGSGRLTTEADPVDLFAGALLWLPRRSRRGFTAGPDGLRYLTVHRRRQALVLEPPSASR